MRPGWTYHRDNERPPRWRHDATGWGVSQRKIRGVRLWFPAPPPGWRGIAPLSPRRLLEDAMLEIERAIDIQQAKEGRLSFDLRDPAYREALARACDSRTAGRGR